MAEPFVADGVTYERPPRLSDDPTENGEQFEFEYVYPPKGGYPAGYQKRPVEDFEQETAKVISEPNFFELPYEEKASLFRGIFTNSKWDNPEKADEKYKQAIEDLRELDDKKLTYDDYASFLPNGGKIPDISIAKTPEDAALQMDQWEGQSLLYFKKFHPTEWLEMGDVAKQQIEDIVDETKARLFSKANYPESNVYGDYRKQTALGEAKDLSNEFNTKLTPEEEIQFEKDAKQNPRLLRDMRDYDVKGLWKEKGGNLSEGHWTDKYKKPNHPTFSKESEYSGVDGYEGGDWEGNTFTPSKTNLEFHGTSELENYFKQAEKDTGAKLKLPEIPMDLGSRASLALEGGGKVITRTATEQITDAAGFLLNKVGALSEDTANWMSRSIKTAKWLQEQPEVREGKVGYSMPDGTFMTVEDVAAGMGSSLGVMMLAVPTGTALGWAGVGANIADIASFAVGAGAGGRMGYKSTYDEVFRKTQNKTQAIEAALVGGGTEMIDSLYDTAVGLGMAPFMKFIPKAAKLKIVTKLARDGFYGQALRTGFSAASAAAGGAASEGLQQLTQDVATGMITGDPELGPSAKNEWTAIATGGVFGGLMGAGRPTTRAEARLERIRENARIRELKQADETAKPGPGEPPAAPTTPTTPGEITGVAPQEKAEGTQIRGPEPAPQEQAPKQQIPGPDQMILDQRIQEYQSVIDRAKQYADETTDPQAKKEYLEHAKDVEAGLQELLKQKEALPVEEKPVPEPTTSAKEQIVQPETIMPAEETKPAEGEMVPIAPETKSTEGETKPSKLKSIKTPVGNYPVSRQSETETVEGAAVPFYETEVPVSELSLDPEVAQFKSKKRPLTGNYDKAAPRLLAWQRLDGSLKVISGRHRLEHLQKTGERTAAVTVLREADGFSARDARFADLLANMRDGQGTVQDYASAFRKEKLSYERAVELGMMREESTGKAGFLIGTFASSPVFRAFEMKEITEKAAEKIAELGRGNDAIQNAALFSIKDLPESQQHIEAERAIESAKELGGFVLTSPEQKGTGGQTELPGTKEDPVTQAVKAIGGILSSLTVETKAQLRQLRGYLSTGKKSGNLAKRFPDLVKEYDLSNETGLRDAIGVLDDQVKSLTKGSFAWTLDSKLVEKVRSIAKQTNPEILPTLERLLKRGEKEREGQATKEAPSRTEQPEFFSSEKTVAAGQMIKPNIMLAEASRRFGHWNLLAQDPTTGKEIGRLEFTTAEGEPIRVKMIEVDPGYRRQGIATALGDQLQEKFQAELSSSFFTGIDWGYAGSEEGEAFLRKMSTRPSPVSRIIRGLPEETEKKSRYPYKDKTVYRGYSRQSEKEAYNPDTEGGYPIFGKALYYALTEKEARFFGPKIEERKVDLERPFVIRRDQEFWQLMKDANVVLDVFAPLEEQKKNTEQLQVYLKEKGHDGVVVDFPSSEENPMGYDIVAGRDIKSLKNYFGEPQVVFFSKKGKQKTRASSGEEEGIAASPVRRASQRQKTRISFDNLIAGLPSEQRAVPPKQQTTTQEEPRPSTKPVKSISAPAVIDSIMNLADVARTKPGKTPLRQATLTNVQARTRLGHYEIRPELARTRAVNDIRTTAHEVAGHDFEKQVFGWKPNFWKRQNRGIQKELVARGKELYGDTKPAKGSSYMREGWAEYLSDWITGRDADGRPVDIRQKMPQTTAWFDGFLKSRPEIARALQDAKDAAHRWYEQTPRQRAEESIVPDATIVDRAKGAYGRIRKLVSVKNWLASKVGLKELELAGEARTKAPLPLSMQPYESSIYLAGSPGEIVYHMVYSGMLNFGRQIVGKSLDETLALARKAKMTAMDVHLYLWAERTKALMNDPRHPGGRNSGLKLSDAVSLSEDLEKKYGQTIRTVAAGIYNFELGVENYAREASPQYDEIFNRIHAVDPGAYIPLQREIQQIDDMWEEMALRAGEETQGSALHRMTKFGSGRRVKPILDSIIVNSNNLVALANKAHIWDKVKRLSSRVEGLGYLMVEKPLDQVVKTNQNLADVLKQTIKEMNSLGFDIGISDGLTENLNLKDIEDELAGQMVAFFGSSTRAPKDYGNFAHLLRWEDGKLHLYEVSGDLHDALTSMDPVMHGVLFDLAFRYPTELKRLGTTGLYLTFAYGTNPAKDLQTVWLNTQTNYSFPVILGTFVQSTIEEMIHTLSFGKIQPFWSEYAKRGGLEHSSFLTHDTRWLAKTRRNLMKSGFRRVIDAGNVVDFVREIFSIPENAGRITEMRLLAKQEGLEPWKEMSVQQADAMMQRLIPAGKRVSGNFGESGYLGRTVNQMVPFFNAGLQGPRSSVQAFQRNPQKFLMKGLQLAVLTGLLWWKNKDDEWWKQLSAKERLLFSHIPFKHPLTGEDWMLRIPRPFEAGGLFMGLPEAILDGLYQQNPEFVKEWLGAFVDTSIPNILPVLVSAATEQLAGPGGRNFFTDRPIVPTGEALSTSPERQYGEYTTETSKTLANILIDRLSPANKWMASPRRIDYLIESLFGRAASQGIRATEDLLGLKDALIPERERGLQDLPVVGTFFRKGGIQSDPRSMREFYDNLQESIYAAQDMDKKSPEKQRLKMMERAQHELSVVHFMRKMVPDLQLKEELDALSLDIAKRVNLAYSNKATSVDLPDIKGLERRYEDLKKAQKARAEREARRRRLELMR